MNLLARTTTAKTEQLEQKTARTKTAKAKQLEQKNPFWGPIAGIIIYSLFDLIRFDLI